MTSCVDVYNEAIWKDKIAVLALFLFLAKIALFMAFIAMSVLIVLFY